MRVIYAPIFDDQFKQTTHKEGKRGLRDAMKARGWVVWEVDYLNDKRFDWEGAVRAFKPHVILTQCHNTPIDLSSVRLHRPNTLIINWNGDVWRKTLFDPQMITWLQAYVDIQLTVNASVIKEYADLGIWAKYWQIGYEPVSTTPKLTAQQHHDIVFMANCYSEERKAFGTWLKSLPYNVGLYGGGWDKLGNGTTLYNFPLSAALARAAKVVIGDNQFPDEFGFVSNRFFETLSRGAFLLHQEVKGLEELTGYKDGVHYRMWRNRQELTKLLDTYLRADGADMARQGIADTAKTFTVEHHSFDARLNELNTIVKQYKQDKANG
jgi:hypothetical protein